MYHIIFSQEREEVFFRLTHFDGVGASISERRGVVCGLHVNRGPHRKAVLADVNGIVALVPAVGESDTVP